MKLIGIKIWPAVGLDVPIDGGSWKTKRLCETLSQSETTLIDSTLYWKVEMMQVLLFKFILKFIRCVCLFI